MSSGRGSKAASGKNPVLRFVLFAACSACGLVAFLLVYVTKLHHEDAARVTGPASVGAPVLSAPGAKRPHPLLEAAADARRLASDRLSGQSWQGLREGGAALGVNRSAGPFHNLPGPAGNVRFTYADIIPEVDVAAYPPTESLLDIVTRWNPDDTDHVPDPFHETLQCFNYSDPMQRAIAEKYRTAEVPFKIFGIPEVEEVVEKWTDPYLEKHMEGRRMSYKIETSTRGNHFMYWVNRGLPKKKYEPPTTKVHNMRFKDW